MKFETFERLWNGHCAEWVKCNIDGKPVHYYCSIRNNSARIVFDCYEKIKNTAKEVYFDSSCLPLTINRYKRAAIIAYAIIKSDPIVLNEKKTLDNLFLKQRLAFFMAIASILQDFDIEEAKKINLIEVYDRIDQRGRKNGNDDFLTSVYKDMLFSELCKNYNVLTMANVFGLLIEEVAGFKDVKLRKSSN